jgi:hypothetical protein
MEFNKMCRTGGDTETIAKDTSRSSYGGAEQIPQLSKSAAALGDPSGLDPVRGPVAIALSLCICLRRIHNRRIGRPVTILSAPQGSTK